MIELLLCKSGTQQVRYVIKKESILEIFPRSGSNHLGSRSTEVPIVVYSYMI